MEPWKTNLEPSKLTQSCTGWLWVVQVVTGDSQEEVIIFRDRQTDRHFIIIYILTCSDQSLAKTVNKSDQRMVISICGQSSLSLLSIFLISHLQPIWPSLTATTLIENDEQDWLCPLLYCLTKAWLWTVNKSLTNAWWSLSVASRASRCAVSSWSRTWKRFDHAKQKN